MTPPEAIIDNLSPTKCLIFSREELDLVFSGAPLKPPNPFSFSWSTVVLLQIIPSMLFDNIDSHMVLSSSPIHQD